MMTTRRSPIACAALAFSAIALAACGTADETDPAVVAQVEEAPTTEEPTAEATPTAPPADETEPTAPEPVEAEPTTEAEPEPASFVADARALTEQGSLVDEGTYRVDTIGTPFSFVADRPLFVQLNDGGFFVLTHPDSRGPDDRDIVMLRLSSLSDPAEPNQRFDDLEEHWPADDIVGWVDNLVDGVNASEPEETTLGGQPAMRIDVEIDEIPCAGGPLECVAFGHDHIVARKFLNRGASYRIWVVDQGDEAPIAVVVGNNDPDSDWFETADEVLSTFALDDPAPSPIFSPPAGPVDLAVLGGTTLELETEAVVFQPGSDYAVVYLEVAPAWTTLVSTPATVDGAAIESTDELIEALRGGGVEVTEIAPTMLGGIDSRVFDIRGVSFDVIRRGEEDERTFTSPPAGQLWVVEHPDRGLLMITAEAWSDDEAFVEASVARATALLSTVTFTESS